MSADQRAYLDTSALAKWYLNEEGSDAFSLFCLRPSSKISIEVGSNALPWMMPASEVGVSILATADAVMAEAAISMGLDVARF